MLNIYYRRLLSISLVCLLMVSSVYGEINIDGVLDEPEWKDAEVHTDFVTVEPLSGEVAKYSTEVRIFTNDEGIFVGFINHQPASVKRVHRRFPRDARIQGDRNIVSVDFDGTALVGYDFTVGSANSQQDGIITVPDYSTDWDGTWYSQTSADEDNWYSEIHIPWTVAPMSNAENGIKNMKFWFSRIVYEESLRFAFPNAYYSRATFLEDWHPIQVKQVKASTLDWFPYLSHSTDLSPDGISGAGDNFNAGLDFIWRPNSATQLTGALKPDFGQVESDDLVVNFSAFETFVSEKRPFFTENQSLFSSIIPNEDRIIYTRRIGSGPAGSEEGLIDIDIAAKASHFGETTDMGFFVVREDNSDDRVSGNFFSSRLQRKVDDIAVGHRLTYVDRPLLQREATVQVADATWKRDATMQVRGQILYSNIQQQANSLNGEQSIDSQDYAGWASAHFAPNDNWFHVLYLSHYGDEFDMNDMGYMKRNDFSELYASTRYSQLEYPAASSLLSSSREIKYGYTENTDGDRLQLWFDTAFEWVFRSSQKLEAGIGGNASGWDDRITRGNGVVAMPAQYWGQLKYISPRGDDYGYVVEAFFENDGADKLSTGITFGQKIFLTETLTLGSRLTYKDYKEWLIWDAEVDQLAIYQADSYEAVIRLDWYPSTKQEVRLKFQWIAIDAETLGSYTLDGMGRLDQSAISSSDFSVSDTAFQIRYRYQLAPLSDVFLVYSRGGFYGSESGDEGVRTLFSEGWQGVQVESVIAKIRYRF